MTRPRASVALAAGLAGLAIAARLLLSGAPDLDPITPDRITVDPATAPAPHGLPSASGEAGAAPLRAEARPMDPLTTDALRARVTGEVVRADSRAGVVGATVTLTFRIDADPRTTAVVCDANGRFVAELPAPCTLLSVGAADLGALLGDRRELGIPLHAGSVEAIRLTLRNGAILGGTVEDEHGQVIPGATVSAWRRSRFDLDREWQPPPPDLEVFADGAGRFEVAPLLDPFTLTAHSPTHVCRYRLSGGLREGTLRNGVVLVVTEQRERRGRVVDPSGRGLPGVPVQARMFEAWGAHMQIGIEGVYRDLPRPENTRTDSTGAFTLSQLPADATVHLMVDQPPYLRASVQVPPSHEEIVIQLRPGCSLTGSIRDRDGPVIGAQVRIDGGRFGADVLATLTTDAHGAFASSTLAPTTDGVLYVKSDSHAIEVIQPVQLSPDQPTRIDVVLAPERLLAGRVVDVEDRPLGDVTVEIEGDRVVDLGALRASPTPTWERQLGIARRTTSADGVFKFPGLYPGRFRITAIAAPPDRERATLDCEAGRTDLVLRLGADRLSTTTLHGFVRDALSGAPIERFSVTPMHTMSGGGRSGHATDFTSADGRFELGGVLPGATVVIVSAAGHVPWSSPFAELPAGSVIIDARLAPARIARLRVIDADGQPLGDVRLRFSDETDTPCLVELGAGSRASSLVTDRDGRVVARGLPAGRIRVEAEAAGWEDGRIVLDLLAPEPAEQTLRMLPARSDHVP